MIKTQSNILIALGANLTSTAGPPSITLRAALSELANKGAAIRSVSPFYSTPAFPAGNGPDYVNAAAKIAADWTAQETLTVLHEVEALFGRARDQRWGQRTLDLDLIGLGDMVLPDAKTHADWRNMALDDQVARTPETLLLPHPRLQDRSFVLVPLGQVAPDWVHPILQKTVLQMCDALDPADVASVKLLQ